MLTLATLALFAGCTEDDTTADYAGGSFTVTIEDVQDDCYDGIAVIFMPEGTPTEFASPVDLPSYEDLPNDATVTLQAPFADMAVTWELGAGEDSIVVVDAAQSDVLLDPDSGDECAVDMVVNVDLTVVDADNITAQAVLTTSGFDEDDCPVVEEDPCDITLTLSGVNDAASTTE
jgi:hypothetical protein